MLTGVHFLQCSEYCGVCVNVCVIHLQVIFADLYMWYFFNVFKCFPILCILIPSTVSAMVPYLCPVFNMWFEYPELLLLLFSLLVYVLCI
jgi:hypothetical protein